MIEAILVLMWLTSPNGELKEIERFKSLDECLVEAAELNNKGPNGLAADPVARKAGLEYLCLKVVRVTV